MPGAVVDLAEIALLEFCQDLRRAGLRHLGLERHKLGDVGGRFSWMLKGEKRKGHRRVCAILMPGVFLSRIRFVSMSPTYPLAVFVDCSPALWPHALELAREKLS